VVRTLITLPQSVSQSVGLLHAVKPGVVIGVGGYSSGPVALAAWMIGIPVLIVEPNSYAGLANRVLGKLAKKIVLPFPGTDRQGFFPAGRVVKTGPLVRKGINEGNRSRAMQEFGLDPGVFTVLVMGGSGGAHAINMAMKDAAKDLGKFQILHQTGEKDVRVVEDGYRAAGVKAKVFSYIHDMAGAYAAADLVVARSGATTVAELAVSGKRAILVPFPFAADNHQEFNARTLADRGGADVIVQKDLTPSVLAAAIQRHAAAGQAEQPAAMPTTAAEDIVRLCRSYVQKN